MLLFRVSVGYLAIYLFKNKDFFLGIAKPHGCTSGVFPGSEWDDPVLRSSERGKSNASFLLLSPSSQEKAGWWTIPTLPVRRLPLLHVPRPGKPLQPLPSQRHSRIGRQAGKPSKALDGVQSVWFQAGRFSLTLAQSSVKCSFLCTGLPGVCTLRHLPNRSAVCVHGSSAPAVDLFVLARTLQHGRLPGNNRTPRGTSRYLGTLSWAPVPQVVLKLTASREPFIKQIIISLAV